MKILIIGNDPRLYHGVTNYTRPLALQFTTLGHDVSYLYSGAWNRRYDWTFRPYLKRNKDVFPFECAEIVNSPNWIYNFDDPLIDLHEKRMEKIFLDYIRRVKPDIMHVHSRLALPVSIIEMAAKNGIKVFNTIHAYGLLCQNRSMIDREGDRCDGPANLEKCTHCNQVINVDRVKLNARIASTSPSLLEYLARLKRTVKSLGRPSPLGTTPGTDRIPSRLIEKRRPALQKRLDYIIHVLNDYATMNICVSTAVRDIFLNYGAREDNFIVSHIGSTIAESQRIESRPANNPLVIGNIGGVGHFKGQHVIISAISLLKRADFVVRIFGRFDKSYVDTIMKGYENLPIEFLGEYIPEHLPKILSQIDIMIGPSIFHDPAPQTIFESYSRGIPMIASDLGGFRDFVKPGINGYLFKAGDSFDLADKINRVLDNPALINEFRPNIPALKTITQDAVDLLSFFEKSLR